jgi:hypothetical protein
LSKDTIGLYFESLSSEELLDIWTINDHDEYSKEIFQVILGILTERGIDIPPQGILSEATTIIKAKSNKSWWRKIPGFRSGIKHQGCRS